MYLENKPLPITSSQVPNDSQVYESSKYTVVICDIPMAVRVCFPTGDKEAIEARVALQQFIGPTVSVQLFHCDGAKELYKACVAHFVQRLSP